MSFPHNFCDIEPGSPQAGSNLNLDLENFDIHPIWRPEAFRLVDFWRLLPLPSLDDHDYDFPQTMYQRMKPALRLATLFLNMALPDLAKVRYDVVRTQHGSHDTPGTGRVLGDRWRATANKLMSFREELLRMSKHYRITILMRNRKGTGDYIAAACTTSVAYPSHSVPHKKVLVQSAMGTEWLDFLARPDWETQTEGERYSYYFLLAATLVHELSHAVWSHRLLPSLELEYRRTRHLTLDRPEPKFTTTDAYAEIGYAIELRLFGGLSNFPHCGTPTSAEIDVQVKRDQILLTILDEHGRAIGVHPMMTSTLRSFFQAESWGSSGDGAFHKLTLDLLPDVKRSGPCMTILTCPLETKKITELVGSYQRTDWPPSASSILIMGFRALIFVTCKCQF